ncbi:MAG: methionyl-tRNA formyltransferase [Gammaproteobacteria bacterium]|nr:methionyl-tRNA formyltransferase [Gammaproteobacteria bacterium]
MRIIFAGTPELAVPILDALIQSPHEIVAVYTQPDRPAGRGRQLHESPVKQLAKKYRLPVFQPEKLREFPHENIDVFVVAMYGLLIPEFILFNPKYGCINVHPSLLPRWRGAAPIVRPLLVGDTETGVTIMKMEKGLDTGDILLQEKYLILPSDNIRTLQATLSTMGAKLLLTTLANLENITPQKQDDTLATYAQKIEKSEYQINWLKSAEEINRQIRAFYPAFSYLEDQLIKIWEAEIIPQNISATPGTIMDAGQMGIDIATGKYILRAKKLQLAGGKPLLVKDILNARAQLFAREKCFKNIS